ncbi:patatin-like phospholipase family protein [Pseudoalteromonas sp. SSDWG2]|uniref:patatin-like phospholipase family protein n=1 Tax=Pseudoalteromonas sp. SSDWG2 TaxID=3139391 RepID=UPI003BA8E89D
MRKQTNCGRKGTALLLSGGGARAAYQVGVLKALTHSMPRTAPLPFRIITGTSAGAINSVALACWASCAHLALRKLDTVWGQFHTSHVYRSDFAHVFGHIIRNVLSSFRSGHANHAPASLFNNSPLRRLLAEVLPMERIDRNIHRGVIDALGITASNYSTGDSITFFQSKDATPWQRSKRQGVKARIHLEHLMASSAIPVVFPSVRIRHQYYGDGSIHQMSPLSSAIHLGAERIFVIGVEQPKEEHRKYAPHYPGMSAIAGHLLDSVFADTIHADLERVERINRTVGLLSAKHKHQELKHIDTFCINPSHNFNEISSLYYDDMPLAIRMLLRGIGVKRYSESSLPSYLLFEKRYTEHLIELGYQDGVKNLKELRHFLCLD